ncbi:MAG: hypothetical protein IJC90_05990 [Clostridia bacterium]|nr:hypothetical protein [Clostridia bacterium]
MDEFSKLLRNFTVISIIIIILIAFVAGSFIAGFKVDYNITGIERDRIGYNREYSKENI